jgi:murein DD-endopeptidase
MPRDRRLAAAWVLLVFFVPVSLTANASQPRVDARHRAADTALSLLNAPYRAGGSRPSTGFDCSGLVQYSYQQAGLTLPRTTEQQRRVSNAIRVADLRRGDLVFFDQEGKKNSHVGIYVGNGRFVHAPSSGKRVRSDTLSAPYWKKHISEARRINTLDGRASTRCLSPRSEESTDCTVPPFPDLALAKPRPGESRQ